MNVIETIAPIAIDDLKKYFTDKTTFYRIDYENSSLKGTKLLTYLSNLDLPSDVQFKDMELVKDYLHFPVLCNIPSLEAKVIDLLLEYKGIIEGDNKQFIEDNIEIVEKWVTKLDSLTLFNMYTVKSEEFKQFVESFPLDETSELDGVNFLSLLKHKDFYLFYNKVDKSKLKFYKTYFTEYMFKGANLFKYWTNENNPLFLLTYGIGAGVITNKQGALDAASIQ
jgi:hypothetical protein